ncbi:MAG: 2-oxoacid:acceptor oxidoreductase family protein [Deltaproteobacteria bacterium]|nr:2-oxoacid:acceptor oxidoreductase family protein [Deltaproteobacteria bacterium]
MTVAVRDSKLEVPFPGQLTATDGTGAVVWVETHISQGACAYPITPSTNMGTQFAYAAANGMRNLWGDPLVFLESESEHSSASAAEGFVLAGGRVSNFTSGQGLVLMKEVLYVISGKRQPAVFNIGARALTSQALNVHAGHDDIMGVADTGWGMLFARNAQESGDLCLIARRCAEATEIPFFNVQDGFLTTHTLETCRLPEPELMKQYIGPPGARVQTVFDPARGIMSGVVQNQDAYMRGKIAQRYYYDRLVEALEVSMQEYHALTGRRYSLVDGYRMEDAEYAIVAMGSTAETAEVVVDHLRETRGWRVGVVHPTAFRPFPGPQLVDKLKNVQSMAIIERLDLPPAANNPLTNETKAAFADALSGRAGYPTIHRMPGIASGSAGLGSRDVRPSDLIAVFEQLHAGKHEYFSLNIDHPSALAVEPEPDVRVPGSFSMRGHSIGGFGSVTTNKAIATVAQELFGVYVQAYPKYGSEKKGLPTTYYLTLASEPIRIHSEMEQAEFLPINDINALQMEAVFSGLSDGGTVFVQWPGTDPKKLWQRVPPMIQRRLQAVGAKMFYLDAARIAREEGSRVDLETRMQGIVLLGVFLRCAPFREQLGDDDALFARVKVALRHYFPRVSDKVIAENLRCVERGFQEVHELPQELIASAEEAFQRKHADLTVSDLMHHGVIACRPHDPLDGVVETMRKARVSAIVVLDDRKHMEGILSTTDLARAFASAPERSQLPDVFPYHLMTREVLVTWPDEPLIAAVDRMLSHSVHRLVVAKSESERTLPVGVLSLSDLTRAGMNDIGVETK